MQIAGFDLRESLRTRRAIVLTLLYVLVSAIASYTYVTLIALAETTKAGVGEMAGGESPLSSEIFVGIAQGFAQNHIYMKLLEMVAGGDMAIASNLATYPVMVLIFVWFSLAFLPWLIALTSYDVVISGLSMLPVPVFGMMYVPHFDLVATLMALLTVWPVIALFAFAVLGPVALASQLVRTPGAARAVALVILIGMWVNSIAAVSGVPYSTLEWLTPFAYEVGFFSPDLGSRLLTGLGCIAVGLGYTGLGFLRFRQRDL